MKKIILFICLITICLSYSKVYALDIEFDVSTGYSSFDEYKNNLCQSSYKYGDLTFREIDIDGKTINLYCEFKEKDEALSNIKNNYADVLNYIKNKYSLNDLSNNNFKEYNNYASIDDNDDYIFDLQDLNIFFETYENFEVNNEIENLVNEYNNEKNNNNDLNSDIIEEIYYMLPSYYSVNDVHTIMPFAA